MNYYIKLSHQINRLANLWSNTVRNILNENINLQWQIFLNNEYWNTIKWPLAIDRFELFSLTGVPWALVLSSLPPPAPFIVFLRIGLSEGGFGSEGSDGLIGGGPGVTSSMICEKMFNSLTVNINNYSHISGFYNSQIKASLLKLTITLILCYQQWTTNRQRFVGRVKS